MKRKIGIITAGAALVAALATSAPAFAEAVVEAVVEAPVAEAEVMVSSGRSANSGHTEDSKNVDKNDEDDMSVSGGND